MRHRVYISGPMSGLPDNNYPSFFAIEALLLADGHDVVNPARTGAEDTAHLADPDWHDYMASAIVRMRGATAICPMPGSERSDGCQIEQIVARRNRLETVFPK